MSSPNGIPVPPPRSHKPQRALVGTTQGTDRHQQGRNHTAAELTLAKSTSTLLTTLDDIREPNGTAVAQISSLDSMLAAHKIGGLTASKPTREGYGPDPEGASATLADAVFVIAEISLVKRFEGSYRLSENSPELARLDFEPAEGRGSRHPDMPRIQGPSGEIVRVRPYLEIE